jgi:hypothetical protein
MHSQQKQQKLHIPPLVLKSRNLYTGAIGSDIHWIQEASPIFVVLKIVVDMHKGSKEADLVARRSPNLVLLWIAEGTVCSMLVCMQIDRS